MRPTRPILAVLLSLVVLASIPGLGAAASIQGASGTITVGPNETVDGIQAVAGTVVIRGTVTGDVQVAAGSLVIYGTVDGDVEAAAGSVDIQGRVGGDVGIGTGSLTIGENAVIEGQLEAGAGSVRVAGTVGDDARIGAGSILLEPTATFSGDLRYDGELEDRGATVQGRLIHDESLGESRTQPLGGIGNALFDVYGFLVSLVVGAVLLLAFPAGSRRLVERVREAPVRTGLYGLGVLIGVPILLVLIAITIIGIPLALIGALLFAITAWVGSIYGRYAVGTWLVDALGSDNRWLALGVGMVIVGAVGLVPIIGGLVEFLVLLVGVGALGTLGLEAARRRRAGADA